MSHYLRFAVVIFMLLFLHGGLQAENYTYTISTPMYEICSENDFHVIVMNDFGSTGQPGAPQLPAKTIMLALPPAATVTNINIIETNPTELSNSYSIKPNDITITGREDGQELFESSRRYSQQEFERNYREIYSSDEFYPKQTGTFLGQGQWRRYTYARVRICPFRYRPRSGKLVHYASCTISIDYEVNNLQKQDIQHLMTDKVLDDIISQHIINFDEAQQWYPKSNSVKMRSAMNGYYDYVIIAENDNIKQAVDKLKTWKENIGHRVRVVTLDTITSNYNGQDGAEKIWNFLQTKFSNEHWGIRYVLLAGNVDKIPTRFLFPSSTGWAYATDYYYAKLTTNWDVDNDSRWGEFSDDNFDAAPDVIVGRIPFNDQATIARVCDNIIDFEQDFGGWKQTALMAMGIMDFNSSGKTDGGDLGEYIKTNIFGPTGWNAVTLYEKGGLDTSKYKSDYPLLEEAFLASCGPKMQGVINLVAHGNSGGMSGHVWAKDLDKDGVCDYSKDKNVNEFTYNGFSSINHIGANFASAIVFLCGCSTAPPCDYVNANVTNSLHPTTKVMDNVTRRYIQNGAPAAIGSSAGSSYRQNWSKPQDGSGQSLDYYFNDYLIMRDQKAGDAFFNAQMTFANNHSLQRGIRVFNYYGDPSLNLKGYEDHPGGADVVIHDGWYQHFAADNAANGDMFVAVITTTLNEAGEVKIYKSTDHGQNWTLWDTISRRTGVYDVDVIVGEYGSDEFVDERLLVFIASADGTVQVYRFPLTGGAANTVTIASEGGMATFWGISANRNPEARWYKIYLTYSILVPNRTQSRTKVCRSSTNGSSWDGYYSYDGFYLSAVDGGVNDQAYLVAKKDDSQKDIYVRRSTDGGGTWGNWVNLTQNDNAYDHGVSEPVVATSTDPGAPTVWVVYPYYKNGDRNKADIRFAYSLNGGSNWTTDKILAEDDADEFGFHLKSYNTGISRWMNCAYIHHPAEPKIVWRWSSGTVPTKWSAARFVNENKAKSVYDLQPRVIYSPGAPATGSGVVYAGDNKLYFSAPWLSGNNNDWQLALIDVNVIDGEQPQIAIQIPEPDDIEVRIQNCRGHVVWNRTFKNKSKRHVISWNGCDNSGAPLNSGDYLCTVKASIGSKSVQFALDKNEEVSIKSDEDSDWLETGDLENAFLVSALAPVNQNVIYAAAAAHLDPERNEGRVFRSSDAGEYWEPLAPLDASWSVSSLLLTENGGILAGGIALFEDQAHGVIYRSADIGQSWRIVFEMPDAVVSDLIRTPDDQILAATGWNGIILRSEDFGETWYPVANLGEHVIIHCIFQAPNGVYFAGVQLPEGEGLIMRSENLEEWQPVEGVEGMRAIYDIIEMEGMLYAGGRGHDMGWVLQSDMDGAVWSKTTEFPDTEIRAVHCLHGFEGKLVAGLEMNQGPSFSRVFYKMPNEQQWHEFGRKIDLSTTVFALSEAEGTLYAGTGYIYGNVYKYAPSFIGVDNSNNSSQPDVFALDQNYPNPFNPTTRINYRIAGNGQSVLTNIKIYDVRGREVVTLINEHQESGFYSVVWDGCDQAGKTVANGIYLCHMNAGNFQQTRRLVLLK